MANKTIGTELKLIGEKEFNQQMKAVNNGLKTTKSDLAALTAEFDGNANSMDALSAKNKLLQASVEQHQGKVNALRAQYEAAAASLGENAATTQKYRQQLNYATVELFKATSALNNNSRALEEAKRSAENAADGVDKVADAADDAVNPIRRAARSIDDLGDKSTASDNKMASFAKGLRSVAGGVGIGFVKTVGAAAAGVTALGVGGVAALTLIAESAREAVDAAKAAQEAGEALTETQQKWLGFSDQLDSISSAVFNAKTTLVGMLLPVLEELSTEGAAFLNDFSRDLNAAAGDSEKTSQVLADYIVRGAKLIKTALPEYVAAGKEIISGLVEGLGGTDELAETGVDLVFDLLDSIIANAPEVASAASILIDALLQGLIDRGPDTVASGIQMVVDLISGLAQGAPDMIPAAVELVIQLLSALVENAPLLLEAGVELVLGIIAGILNSLGDIGAAAKDILDHFVDAFAEKVSMVNPLGGDIVRGIWAGIEENTQWIFDKISGWVGDVVAWIKAKLGIESPSKVMADEVGFWMARGVGVGWEKEMANVNKKIAGSINTSFNIPDIDSPTVQYSGRKYTAAAGKTVNLYVTAKSITEADISMLLDLVNRKLGDDL